MWNRAGAVRLFSFYTRASRQPLVSHYLRVCVRACVRVCVRACRCVFPDILDLTPHLPTLCMTMHHWSGPSHVSLPSL